MTIAVFILRVNTNVENWSVNTGLTGIRRNMIHLENSWLLSWKILAAQKLGSKHSTHRDTQPRLPKKYDTPVVICLCLQISRYQFIHKYSPIHYTAQCAVWTVTQTSSIYSPVEDTGVHLCPGWDTMGCLQRTLGYIMVDTGLHFWKKFACDRILYNL